MNDDYDTHWHDTGPDNFKAYARLMWFGVFLIAAGLGVWVWSAS